RPRSRPWRRPRPPLRRADSCRAPCAGSLLLVARERPDRALAELGALAQIVIGDHARHHGLADWHGANADAGIVPALGGDLGLAAEAVDRAPRIEDRRGRLDREAADHRLPGRNAAEAAAGPVREKERLAAGGN